MLSCAKPQMVVRRGVEMQAEEAARLDYKEAELFFAKRIYKKAIPLYQSIVETPPTSYTDNAFLRLGQIHRFRKQYKDAKRFLEIILLRYPTGDVIDRAKEELGRIHYRKKNFRRAAELLLSIPWSNVPAKRRTSLEKITRQTAQKAELQKEILPWLLSIFDETQDGPEKLERHREIVDTLDQELGHTELRQLLSQRHNRFPAGYAYFKLAKLARHTGDPDKAQRWLTSYLNRFPNHEYSREAILLSEKLYRTDDVDPHALGLLLPMSGPRKVYADQVLRGVALAIDVFSKKTELNPKIRLYIADTGDNPQQAAEALEELLAKRKVIAAMGPLFSTQAQAAAMVALDSNLPMITLSPAEGITQIGKTIFRNSITKSEQAVALAALATNVLRIRRAAILYPQNNYGAEFMSLFWNEFEKRGGEIRGAESYPPTAGDYGEALKRLVGLKHLEFRRDEICSQEEAEERSFLSSNKPMCYPAENLPPIVDFEALFVPDSYERAVQIAPALAYYDVRGVALLGTNLWNTREIFRGGSAEYLQGAIFLGGFFANRKLAPATQFVERYYSTYGSEPGVIEAQAYDTASLMLAIISRRNPGSRRAFRGILGRVSKYPGVTGHITFDESRNALRDLAILTIDGKQIVELY